MHNTSRVEGEPYGNLLSEKKFRGFPTMAYMDAEGEVLTSSMPRSVDGFRSVHAALGAEQALAAKAKAGKLSPADTGKWLIARMDLGKVELEAAQTEFASIEGKLSAEQKKEIGPRLVDMEVAQVMNSTGTAMRGKPQDEMEDALAEKYGAMLKAKKIPSDKAAARFWLPIMRSAERGKDEATATRAKTELEALAARDPSQKAMIERMLNPPARRESVPAAKIK